MKLFAISDLHLSGARPKPMDIFGENWNGHWQKIRENWSRMEIGPEDLVLIPGDISWAMQLEAAQIDLDEIGQLPGHKVVTRGNHDYWWSSLTKVRSVLPEKLYALQNDAMRFGSTVVCGSRGWICPGGMDYKPEDEKIYKREVLRMELSLKGAKKQEGDLLIVMIHYPPFNEKQERSGFMELFEQYGVDQVIYGHLHGRSCRFAFEKELCGIQYRLVSCDHLQFCPVLLAER